MGFDDILHGHIPFGVAVFLLVLVLGFFIFMSARMFKKSKDKTNSNEKQAKTYGILFALASGATLLILVAAFFLHYHISIKV